MSTSADNGEFDSVIVPDEFEAPPENQDVYDFTEPLDEMEFELPESEDFPPSELQGRLEQPTTIINTIDENGRDVVLQLDPATDVGVEPVWTETDGLTGGDEDSSLGTLSVTGGQLQTDADSDQGDLG